MITAAEARNQVEQGSIAANRAALDRVEGLIKHAIQIGMCETNVFLRKGFPVAFVTDHLKLLGYQVSYQTSSDQRDPDSIKISW